MTSNCQRIDQIQNGIGALTHTLVYCFSELLDLHVLGRLCFYQQFHFLLRCYFLPFFLSNSKVKILHRVLTSLFADRAARLDRTYQLNLGGNTDFMNMLERERLNIEEDLENRRGYQHGSR